VRARRLVTIVPPLVIVLLRFETTGVLVASQTALYLELPFILLLWFSTRQDLMGTFPMLKPSAGEPTVGSVPFTRRLCQS